MDVIKVHKAGSLSDGFVEQVAIGGDVHLDDEGRKEDMHTKSAHPNKAASSLALMGSQAVEGVPKVGTWRQSQINNFLPLRDIIANPWPAIGAKELFPI